MKKKLVQKLIFTVLTISLISACTEKNNTSVSSTENITYQSDNINKQKLYDINESLFVETSYGFRSFSKEQLKDYNVTHTTGETIIFAHNPSTETFISVKELGLIKNDLSHLETELKNNTEIKNLKINQSTPDKISYQFSYNNNNLETHENCQVIISSNRVGFSACVFSNTRSHNELDNTISDFGFINNSKN